jgi:hypothetical protein
VSKLLIDSSSASFVGTAISDEEIFGRLPQECSELLLQVNGCVLFGGGLHIRGACIDPDWHSLRRVWFGEDALSSLYRSVLPDDIPLAQNFLGDQFLLRSHSVFRLDGETGEMFDLEIGWLEFLKAAQNEPTTFLSLDLLHEYEMKVGVLQPGYLLNVYPALCTKEASCGVSTKAIPAHEQLRFLADFAAQIAALPDGSAIRITMK